METWEFSKMLTIIRITQVKTVSWMMKKKNISLQRTTNLKRDFSRCWYCISTAGTNAANFYSIKLVSSFVLTKMFFGEKKPVKWGSDCLRVPSVMERTIGMRFFFFSFWWWCRFSKASRTFTLTLSSNSWDASWWSRTMSVTHTERKKMRECKACLNSRYKSSNKKSFLSFLSLVLYFLFNNETVQPFTSTCWSYCFSFHFVFSKMLSH